MIPFLVLGIIIFTLGLIVSWIFYGVVSTGNLWVLYLSLADYLFAMLGLGLWSLWARWRGTLYTSHLLHRAAVLLGPAGFVAVIAGWVTTEVGRQPWTVYGLLRTADSVSPLGAPAVATSLIAFIIVYFTVFGFGTWYILRLMAKGVQVHEPELEEDEGPIRTAGITPGPAQHREGA